MPRWFAGFACLLGVFLVGAGYHLWRAGLATATYTRTRGRVVRAEVEELPRTSEEGGPRFRPLVRYAYDVRGRTYESERMAVGSPAAGLESADARDARRVVERYPPGAGVDVWFDPRDPRHSVLERGTPRAQIVLAVAAGIALLGFGMFVLSR